MQSQVFQMPTNYITGLLWCAVYGLGRGGSYASQKIGKDLVSPKPDMIYYILSRCGFIAVFSYFYGKNSGIDFSWFGWKTFRALNWETQK